jgi:hypothetical protein
MITDSDDEGLVDRSVLELLYAGLIEVEHIFERIRLALEQE